MGDSFFGFNADSSTTKIEKNRGHLDDLMTEGIVEEEYDALNDETFGSGTADAEDWELDHEKLAKLVVHKGQRDSPSPSKFYFDDPVLDGDYSQQEIVQKSISQLGLEDDLDDPAIMTIGRKHSGSNCSQTYFRQSPPPPAILDTECGSPKTHSIWSTTHSTPGKDSGLCSLLQSITRNSGSLSSFQNSTSPVAPLSGDVFHTPFQSKAWTVEEVERNFLFSNKSPCSSSPGSDWTPNHLVPNEALIKLQKEITSISRTSRLPKVQSEWLQGAGDCKPQEFVQNEDVVNGSWKMRTPPLPMSSGVRTLDDVEKDILLRPRAQTLSDVERQLQGSTPVKQNVATFESQNISNNRVLPSPIGTKLRTSSVGVNQSSPPSKVNMPIKAPYPITGNGMFPVGRQHHPLLNPHSPVGNLFSKVQSGIPWIPPVNPLQMQNAVRNFTPSIPSNFIRPCQEPRLQCDPRMINHPFLQRQFAAMGCFDKRLDFNNMRHPSNNFCDDYSEEDEDYSGLMLQKEKDWLIKIQMMLLKVDDPYNQDYYYSSYSANRYAKLSKKSTDDAEEPMLILPERTKQEVKAYVPAQYEGSLGKLQAVSVNFPRRVIDATVTRHVEEEGQAITNHQSLQKYRRLLIDIEKLYTALLEIGDEERRIAALPDEAQIPHKDNIVSLTDKIYSGLGCEMLEEDSFQNIMSVRKGRNLTMRIFKLFTKDQQMGFLEALLRHLPIILKKDHCDVILLRNCAMILDLIKKLTLNELVRLGESLENVEVTESVAIPSPPREKSGFIPAFKNQFGTSVICCMFQRGEEIYAGYDLLESGIQARWAKIALHAVDILCTIPDDSITPPLKPFVDLFVHFQRFFGDKDKYQLLQDKVKVLECDSRANHNSS